ncbi:MAG: bifunctional pantoate--beta-alanine ligase/(d)CMP kinase [Prochloraceae cyanobacterium]|nr:bifunctional pantoate--beta-alanine ligase/(d)CMP kinase [Prochloraceae cyanobacterium]
MRVYKTIAGLRSDLESLRAERKIALVPTMGALHIGHLTTIERAVRENDTVVVSIFVNPLQFGPNEDLDRYPRQLEKDARACEKIGVDFIFAPSAAELYQPGQATTQVAPPETMTSVLCGKYRPGHFVGVATIVTKLLNIVQPNTAYFGEKDAQQLAIIRRLVKDLNLPVKIVGCATVREESGLAYSSRNQYLTAAEKESARVLSRSLLQAKKAFLAGDRNSASLIEIVSSELAKVPLVKVEYVELVDRDTLVPVSKITGVGLLAMACYVGSTRLIDNVVLTQRKPIIAIDGPAGAGKSTVTRNLAESLGLLHLDTGAMYRAVTWLIMESDLAVLDEAAIAELVASVKIDLVSSDSQDLPTRIYIDSQDVTEVIRTPKVTANVSAVSAIKSVRTELVKQQQRWGENGGIVVEGRDIGTNVFPDAELKIYLTASTVERAKRRAQDLQDRGIEKVNLKQLEYEIQQRDYRDSTRAIDPLKKADDAIEINTDGLSVDDVTNKIVTIYRDTIAENS